MQPDSLSGLEGSLQESDFSGFMKVIFCNRHDAFECPGGDTVQMLMTKEYLEKLYPIKVEIILEPDPSKLSDSNIVHIFNLQTIDETLAFSRLARSLGKPIAISTIFWDLSHAAFVMYMAKLGFLEPAPWWSSAKKMLDLLAPVISRNSRFLKYFSTGQRRKYREAVSYADVLLPNSDEESSHVANYIGRRIENAVVVKNALDNSIFHPPKDERREKSVLCVGRIEPNKNQLGLLRALRDMNDFEITLIGKPVHEKYFQAVQKCARLNDNVRLITRDCQHTELATFYSMAQVHVLPSFRESPGLVSLESLAMGCNVVVAESAFCPIKTYFSEWLDTRVFLCNPYSPSSIKTAVEKATAQVSPLPQMLSLPNWHEAAVQTMEAYKRIALTP